MNDYRAKNMKYYIIEDTTAMISSYNSHILVKAHNKMLKDQEKAERLELERIAAKNRRLQKKQEKRAKTKDVKLEEAIEMHKEAYLRAMKEYKNDKKKEK